MAIGNFKVALFLVIPGCSQEWEALGWTFYVDIRKGFSHWGNLARRGHLAVSGDLWGCRSSSVGGYWHIWWLERPRVLLNNPQGTGLGSGESSK